MFKDQEPLVCQITHIFCKDIVHFTRLMVLDIIYKRLIRERTDGGQKVQGHRDGQSWFPADDLISMKILSKANLNFPSCYLIVFKQKSYVAQRNVRVPTQDNGFKHNVLSGHWRRYKISHEKPVHCKMLFSMLKNDGYKSFTFYLYILNVIIEYVYFENTEIGIK